MGSAFNPQILVDKLAKLNSSQQSIETLSHWCIFHMNKATQVVETWARQFHCAPRDQRLAFLYLANDIIQNSRRKGAEFVAEFWKVLPDSLRDMLENGDESGRNAALRLTSIWEERKVFGSRGQILKEDLIKKPLDNGNRKPKHAGLKLRPPGGNALDKLVSGYEAVYSSQLDEDAIFDKCRNAISFVDKVGKDIVGDYRLGHVSGSIRDELKGQHAILRDCIEQLTVVESFRGNLLSVLGEALLEQEYKLEQVRNQLQAAQSHSDLICKQLSGTNDKEKISANQSGSPNPPSHITPRTTEQSNSVIYTRKLPFTENSEKSSEQDSTKSTAAEVAAKLTASTSSAQMLTYVLSSLASEGVIGNKEPTNSYNSYYPSSETKRAKLENENHTSELNLSEPPPQPPPPSSPPPPLPPLPPPIIEPYQYMQMPIPNGLYNGYFMSQLQPPPPFGGPPTNGVSVFAPPAYQGYPTEGGFYGQQQASLPMAPQ